VKANIVVVALNGENWKHHMRMNMCMSVCEGGGRGRGEKDGRQTINSACGIPRGFV
jgi:hypothetical protein